MLNNAKANLFSAALLSAGLLAMPAQATIVKVETNLGDFEINLYDESTPKTVTNFLDYVNDDAYTNSIVHRSIDDFVIQAGSYTWSIDTDAEPAQTEEQFNLIDTNDVVMNEPLWSNVKGTVAMAKGTDEDSATSGWFVNLNDENVDNLDLQSGGFTVFGEVISGLEVVEQINGLPVYYLNSSITNLPLYNLAEDSTTFETENLVLIKKITVTDTAVDSAKDLNPAPNTLIYQDNLDSISFVATEISADVEDAEDAYTQAKAAAVTASEISAEKGQVAQDAVDVIAAKLLVLDQQLALAEDYVTDAQVAEDNDASVLEIVEIRKQAVEAYYEAADATSEINSALTQATNAAKEESSSGGSMSAWFVMLCGLVFWRRARQ